MALEHWVWLSNLDISRRAMLQLLDRFGDPQRIYEAPERDIRALHLEQNAEVRLLQPRDLHVARAILSTCVKKNIGIVTMQDAAYPNRLRNIEYPPVLLYVGGHLPSFDEEAAIGVVGTRTCSSTARQIASRFGYELADKGMLVVSGMAKGIDSAANRGALQAGRRTVAVLGCGVDVCYPSENRDLYEQILAGNGCLLSEYPPGTKPLGYHFPERNRIISGLCAGILVVAAPQKSGSLITASQALEQGREIFVVPGGITDPEFSGSNSLIKQGAIPVTTPKDIVAYYYARFPDAFDDRVISRYMGSGLRRRRRKDPDEEAIRPEEPPLPAAAPVPETAQNPEPSQEPEPVRAERPPYLSLPEKPMPAPIVASPLPQRNLSQYIVDKIRAAQGRVKQYDSRIFPEMGNISRKPAAPKPSNAPAATPDAAAEETAPKAPMKPAAVSSDVYPPEQQKLLAILREHPDETAHIDELVNQSGFPAAEALALLTEMEMDGLIEALPGKRFHII
ncbi:MAG: DNA-protecting protein DprA [Ruminococcaceae bacterium]|nr:DNA-protecting protein DprA [Oscillospiraceae bacterium]